MSYLRSAHVTPKGMKQNHTHKDLDKNFFLQEITQNNLGFLSFL